MAQAKSLGPIDLHALQECATRIREQVERLDAKDDDDDDDHSAHGDGDGGRAARHRHSGAKQHQYEDDEAATKGLSKDDVKRLGLTHNFLKERRRTGLPQTDDDDEEDASEEEEGASSSDSDFLVFHRSELKRVDESFNVGMSRATVQELLDKFQADERAYLTQGIANWFSRAAAHADTMQDQLNAHELNCTQEEMNMEEAYRELGTVIQSRDVKTIQHMRRFHDKIQELRPKTPPAPEEQLRPLGPPPKPDKNQTRKKMLEELQAEQAVLEEAESTGGRPVGSILSPGGAGGHPQARASNLLHPSAAAAAPGTPRIGSTSGTARGPGGQGSVVGTRSELSEAEASEAEEPEEEDPASASNMAVMRRRGHRVGLFGAAELLRATGGGHHDEKHVKPRRSKKDHGGGGGGKGGGGAGAGILASDLLEVIAQQQDEIAHLKTRNDFSAKGTESMRMALEYVRIQHEKDEQAAITGQADRPKHRQVAALPEAAQEVLNDMRENLKVKVIGDMLVTKEGRDHLRSAEGMNSAIGSQVRAAELMEEVEHLTASIKDLEAEAAKHMPPAQRIEVLRQEIEARTAEIERKRAANGDHGAEGVGPARSMSPPSRPGSGTLQRQGSHEAPGLPGAGGELPPGSRPVSAQSRSASKPPGAGAVMAHQANYSWLLEAPDSVIKQIEAVYSEVERNVQELQEQRGRLFEAVSAAKQRVALEEEEKTKGTVNFKDTPEDASLEELRIKVKEAQQSLMEVRSEAQVLQTEEDELRAELKRLRENKKQVTQAMTAATREEAKAKKSTSRGSKKGSLLHPHAKERSSILGQGGHGGGHGHEEEGQAHAEAGEHAAAGGVAGNAAAHQKVMEKLRVEVEVANEDIQKLEVQRGELAARVERMRKAREETSGEQPPPATAKSGSEAVAESEQGAAQPGAAALAPSTPRGAGTKSSVWSSPGGAKTASSVAPDSPTAQGSSASSATGDGDPIGPNGLPTVILNQSISASDLAPTEGGDPSNSATSSPKRATTRGHSPTTPGSARSRRAEGHGPVRSLSSMSNADGGEESRAGSPAVLNSKLMAFPEPSQSQSSSRPRSSPTAVAVAGGGGLRSRGNSLTSSRPGSRLGGLSPQAKPSDVSGGLAGAVVKLSSRPGSPQSDAEGGGSGSDSDRSARSQHAKRDGDGSALPPGTHFSSMVSQSAPAPEGTKHFASGADARHTVTVDKREEQVQDLLMYQSEHTRLERQLHDIEERIREAKLKASGKTMTTRPSTVVKSLIIPEENRAMRKEVTSKQRELNLLRKRWWKEKSRQGGANEDIFAGQAEAVATMLILNPPEVPANVISEGVEEGSEEGFSSSEEEEGSEERKSEQATAPAAWTSRTSTMGRPWFGLEAATRQAPSQPIPNMQRRHSMHPSAMSQTNVGTIEGRRVGAGSLSLDTRHHTRRRSSLGVHKRHSAEAAAAAAAHAAETGESKGRMRPMDQFERILLTTAVGGGAGPHPAVPAGGGPGRRMSMAGAVIPPHMLKRRQSQPASMLEGAIGAQAVSGLVGKRAGGKARDKDSDSSGSLTDGSDNSDSEGSDGHKKPPLPRGLPRPSLGRQSTGLGADAVTHQYSTEVNEVGHDGRIGPMFSRKGSWGSRLTATGRQSYDELNNALLVSSPGSRRSADVVPSAAAVAERAEQAAGESDRRRSGGVSFRDLRPSLPVEHSQPLTSSPRAISGKEMRALMQPILEK